MNKKMNKSVYLTAALYIILGAVLAFYPKITLMMIAYLLAGVAILSGLVSVIYYFSKDVTDTIYRYDFVNGVMMIALGAISILKMDLLMELIPIIMGVLILWNGIIKLQHSIDLNRIKYSGWVYVLIFSLLCVSVGIVLILQPGIIVNTLMVIIGISFLFCGITDIVTLVLLKKRMTEYVNTKDISKEKSVNEENKEAMNDNIQKDEEENVTNSFGDEVEKEKSKYSAEDIIEENDGKDEAKNSDGFNENEDSKINE